MLRSPIRARSRARAEFNPGKLGLGSEINPCRLGKLRIRVGSGVGLHLGADANTLHYITLHLGADANTLHYITLHYITSHLGADANTLHYITLHLGADANTNSCKRISDWNP